MITAMQDRKLGHSIMAGIGMARGISNAGMDNRESPLKASFTSAS
jgi:hypothetical protein